MTKRERKYHRIESIKRDAVRTNRKIRELKGLPQSAASEKMVTVCVGSISTDMSKDIDFFESIAKGTCR